MLEDVCQGVFWKPEDNLWELFRSFYYSMGSGNPSQVIRLGSRHSYPLSHPTVLQVTVSWKLSLHDRTGPMCYPGMTLRMHGA